MNTPIRAQYLRLKRPFPDALLLFRRGDVYELYDHDATIAARELGMTLTTREIAGDERIPLCPLAYHAAEGHIKRLVARGYKVAIAEQIGDPRTVRGLVTREVVRVVTPSSVIEAQRHPSPGRMGGPSGVEPQGSGTPRSCRGMLALIPPTHADGRVAAPHGGRDERVAAPAVQLTLFNLPTGGDDRGR